jgi:uncharacterized DUF497 family protein
MAFEFDSNKSKGICEKHGIDFHEAQVLCTDEGRLEIPAKTLDEPRYLVIEKIINKYWSAAMCYLIYSITIGRPCYWQTPCYSAKTLSQRA